MQILITWPTLKQSQSLDEAIFSSIMKTIVKAYSGMGSKIASRKKFCNAPDKQGCCCNIWCNMAIVEVQAKATQKWNFLSPNQFLKKISRLYLSSKIPIPKKGSKWSLNRFLQVGALKAPSPYPCPFRRAFMIGLNWIFRGNHLKRSKNFPDEYGLHELEEWRKL